MALILACSNPLGQGGDGSTGSLSITIGNNINARIIGPAISMDAASFRVEGSGPGGSTFSLSSTGGSVGADKLAFGTWHVVVLAYDDASILIGRGEAEVGVHTGRTSSVSISVVPLTGQGSLDVSVTWTAADVEFPSITASLAPAQGSALPLPFSAAVSGASRATGDFPTGYYALSLSLLDNGVPVMGAADLVRIVAGQASSGSFLFDKVNKPGGAVQVGISPNLQNPLIVGIAGATQVLAEGATLNLGGTVSGYSGNVLYVWYLDGTSASLGSSYSFGAGLPRGEYRVDLIAFSSDGLRAGSATAKIAVVDPAAYAVISSLSGGSTDSYTSFVVKSDGALLAFGGNSGGQLGIGGSANVLLPTIVHLGVKQIAASSGHSLMVMKDGSLLASGYNLSGQLGDGTTSPRAIPVKVMDGALAAAVSQNHSLALKSDGSLWAFGGNYYGQLGNGMGIDSSIPVQVLDSVASIAASDSVSFAIKTDGSLWGWGWNVFGQLGDGTSVSKRVPTFIMDGAAEVAAGPTFTLVRKTDGSLWAFGDNSAGVFGSATPSGSLLPVQVMAGVARVAAGGSHVLVLKTDGSLWSFGRNSNGQLGNGSTADSPTPLPIATGVAAIAAGSSHSLMLKTDGSLWAWGFNNSGQLGGGSYDFVAHPSPALVSLP